MRRTASLALHLLPLPLKAAFKAARTLGARAVVLRAEWSGGFERPGTVPVDELNGRVLHDFRRVLRENDLQIAAIDVVEAIREGPQFGGESGLDRIYALGVASIELLSALTAGATRSQNAPGILSLELAPNPATAGGKAPAAIADSTALRELTNLGLNRGVRVGLRSVGPGWSDNARHAGWLNGLGLDMDLPELRRFGQPVTAVLESFKNQILHVRCDDYELNLKSRPPGGLFLPQSVQKADPETLDELTIFLEHAGFEGAWTLKAVPPAVLGTDPLQTLRAAMATLQKT